MERFALARELVLQAGAALRESRLREDEIQHKSGYQDLVTRWDKETEQFLRRGISEAFPQDIIVGEEYPAANEGAEGCTWYLDPIDGTTNFVRGLRQSAISVALARDGQVEYAVVFDPYKNEMFSARRGGGAFLNGAPIHVSGKPLAEGIFGMGTAIYRREYLEPTMRVTEQLFRRACDFRRLGAAALDLCDVACGRVELFFEYSLCPWDFAAGSLIITEAGGHISTLQGGSLVLTERCSVWASNDVNKDILRELEI